MTDLQFTPEQSHLISCSQDGSVAIYRVGSWQMEKVWTEAHKGTGIDVGSLSHWSFNWKV